MSPGESVPALIPIVNYLDILLLENDALALQAMQLDMAEMDQGQPSHAESASIDYDEPMKR